MVIVCLNIVQIFIFKIVFILFLKLWEQNDMQAYLHWYASQTFQYVCPSLLLSKEALCQEMTPSRPMEFSVSIVSKHLSRPLTFLVKNIYVHAYRAYIELWIRQEVWRSRKMRKSSSRRSREQLWLFECSPNFPSASVRPSLSKPPLG